MPGRGAPLRQGIRQFCLRRRGVRVLVLSADAPRATRFFVHISRLALQICRGLENLAVIYRKHKVLFSLINCHYTKNPMSKSPLLVLAMKIRVFVPRWDKLTSDVTALCYLHTCHSACCDVTSPTRGWHLPAQGLVSSVRAAVLGDVLFAWLLRSTRIIISLFFIPF